MWTPSKGPSSTYGTNGPRKAHAMRTGETDVKGEGNSLGSITFSIFETVQEAVEDLGAEKVLEQLNVQVKTTAMNQHRQKHTAKMTKGRLKELAWERITVEEFQQAQGDQSKLNDLIAAHAKNIEKEYDLAKAQTASAEAPSSDGE